MSGGRLPVATGKDVVRALRSAGFVVDRIVGSHHVMTFPTDPTRTVTAAISSPAPCVPSYGRPVSLSKNSPSFCNAGRSPSNVAINAEEFADDRINAWARPDQ
jgi:predicted RNA binding protein YcfA (HicA-like mRNA interferase family)